MNRPIHALLGLLLFSALCYATAEANEDVYLSPETFLAESFASETPSPSALWITKGLKPEIRKILGHDYPALRVRYWQRDQKTAWILEEIGKVKPITVGIVVEANAIDSLRVLIYRESHGWEVKYPFFTDQFEGAELNDKLRLDQNIDGISGATLSVNALKKLSRLALLFHQTVTETPEEK